MIIPRVKITEAMRQQAEIEARRRDAYIRHHFEVEHLSYEQRDQLGFIGEFACCSLLGIDWLANIRENYYTIDEFDFIINGKKIDVKTETLPAKYARKILKKTMKDNQLYGCRLINENQVKLLAKYDLIIFSLFARENLDYWFPIGYLETSHILNNYPPTKYRPDGGTYPFAASPIPTSALKPIFDLIP